jgi:hypothetical protein
LAGTVGLAVLVATVVTSVRFAEKGDEGFVACATGCGEGKRRLESDFKAMRKGCW